MYKNPTFFTISFSCASATEPATLYSDSLYTSSQTKTMDKLMQSADQAASENTSSSSTSMTVSPDKFQIFMKKNPIWNFFQICKSDYMGMPEVERAKLIDNYYRHMSDGKSNFNFLICLIHLRMLALGLSKFFFSFFSIESNLSPKTQHVIHEYRNI